MFVSAKDITDYINPMEEKGIVYLERNRDEVLKILMEKGVSYPSEISRVTGVYIEAVNQILNQLVKIGFIKKIYPNALTPQPVFRGRMLEFWTMGISTFENFSRYSWWVITPAGIEYLRVKYQGEGLKIKSGLLTMYEMSHPDKI